MKKLTISKEQIDALLTYISDNECELHTARYRLDGISEFVEQEELPPAFLAFEILEQLALANENGFKSNQYLYCSNHGCSYSERRVDDILCKLED